MTRDSPRRRVTIAKAQERGDRDFELRELLSMVYECGWLDGVAALSARERMDNPLDPERREEAS